MSAGTGGPGWEFARSFWAGLTHLLYPGYCVLCQRDLPPASEILCADCLRLVTSDPMPSCPRCAATVGPFALVEEGCSRCRDVRHHFDATVRLGDYADLRRDLVLQLKYGQEWLAEAVGRLWAVHRAERLQAERPDLVVPVPLHWVRRLLRGYNQSEALAREIAGFLRIPCTTGLLRRVRATRQQRTLESHEEKRENVRGAFRAGGEVLRGRTVLLVDDVMTSGSTASEAARVLKAAGATRVVVAVLARAS